jgi:hypothetical protein
MNADTRVVGAGEFELAEEITSGGEGKGEHR